MLKSLGGILTNSTQTYRGKDDQATAVFDFLQLVSNWQQVVGENLAQKTIPLKIQQKSLIILTDHPVYSQQLSFLEGQLKQKIFTTFPAIKGKFVRIFFQTNPAHFQRQKASLGKTTGGMAGATARVPRTLHPYSPQYQRLKKEGEQLLQEITDPAIKQQLLSLYIQLHQERP